MECANVADIVFNHHHYHLYQPAYFHGHRVSFHAGFHQSIGASMSKDYSSDGGLMMDDDEG